MTIGVVGKSYPRVLTIAMRKGGVGKTRIAYWVCELAARRGLRVLAADFDSQCDLSTLTLPMRKGATGVGKLPPLDPELRDDPDWPGDYGSIAHLIDREEWITYPATTAPGAPSWEICPGETERLNELSKSPDPRVRDALRRLLTDNIAAVADDYDLVVIDTSPSFDLLAEAARRCATHVLFPFEASRHGITALGEMYQSVRAENMRRSPAEPKLRIAGILPSRVNMNYQGHLEILEELATLPVYNKELISPWIPLRSWIDYLDAADLGSPSIFDRPDRKQRKVVADIERAFSTIFERIFDEAK